MLIFLHEQQTNTSGRCTTRSNGAAARNKNTAQSLAQLSSKTHKAKTNREAQKATRGDMIWAGQ